jgi:hypothetical protein
MPVSNICFSARSRVKPVPKKEKKYASSYNYCTRQNGHSNLGDNTPCKNNFTENRQVRSQSGISNSKIPSGLFSPAGPPAYAGGLFRKELV